MSRYFTLDQNNDSSSSTGKKKLKFKDISRAFDRDDADDFVYNPDGTRSFVNLKQDVLEAPESKKQRTEERSVRKEEEWTLPWSKKADDHFFPTKSFKQKAPEGFHVYKLTTDYFEFEKFYTRFLVHKARAEQKGANVLDKDEQEFDQLKEALKHFETFLNQKRQKIEEVKLEHDPLLKSFFSAKGTGVLRNRNALPIDDYKQQIIDAVRNNDVVIIAADTGAGKSTQVPQYLLSLLGDNTLNEESGQVSEFRIGITQPRRLACIGLAKRVSAELRASSHETVEVGYKIRFDSSFEEIVSSGNSGFSTVRKKLLFMTEGILLRQLNSFKAQKDEEEDEWYDILIIDEVHERHAMGDFILGVLKKIISLQSQSTSKRKMKLVLMSATINAELFSVYFNGAPLISVPGKTFPVEIEYWSSNEIDENLVDERLRQERATALFKKSIPISKKIQKFNTKPFIDVIKYIDTKYPIKQSGGGDLLIFLSGMQEITQLADEIEKYNREVRSWIVLKLHSTLSIQKQDLVFNYAPAGFRKCILSTNIAETSVTIDGIKFVIDSGRCRELEYDSTSNLSRLQEFWISKASAKQRAGRAGRTGPGRCFRLYSEKEYDGLNEFQVPELLRGGGFLEQIVLQMKSLHITRTINPREFDFVEKTPPGNIDFALNVLIKIGALNEQEQLTNLGYTLSLLPMDVVLAKMLILGGVLGVHEPMLVLAAALSVQNPMLRDTATTQDDFLKKESEQAEWKMLRASEIESKNGDPFTLLQLFQMWLKVKNEKEMSSRVWCMKMGVEEQRLYEMAKLIEQFRLICKTQLGFEIRGDRSSNSFGGRSYSSKLKYHRTKYEQLNENQSEKRKELQKPMFRDVEEQEYDINTSVNEAVDDATDINSLEFDAKIDSEYLYNRIAKYVPNKLSETQQRLLQLILSSGLFPNLAVPDEGNTTRRTSDYVYHTRFKRFVMIHPSSIYYTHPEYLQFSRVSRVIEHSTIRSQQEMSKALEGEADLGNSKSSKTKKKADVIVPEFLCFLQLMEITKPYLINNFSVPALASCLLFGRQIDTNGDLSVIVVDEYFVILTKPKARFQGDATAGNSKVTEAMTEVLKKIVLIRKIWNNLLNSQLANRNNAGSALPQVGVESEAMKFHLNEAMLKFMPSSVKSWYQTLNHLSSVVGAASQKSLSSMLEELLMVEKTVFEANGVFYEVDTLRDQDLKSMFPSSVTSAEDFDKNVEHLDFKLCQISEGKVGLPLTSFLNYGTIHHPSYIFFRDSAKEDKQPELIIGAKRNQKMVLECPKCKMAKLMSELEFDEHVAACKGVEVKKLSLLESNENLTEEPSFEPKTVVVVQPFSSGTKGLSTKTLSCPFCQLSFKGALDLLRHKKVCTERQ
ncbi:hypothetical protein MP638_004072 [Amoeboaphelidium occidentale]|nr:hypothetical protein MP638_004072 [Amoeboaphelidium occidentale]